MNARPEICPLCGELVIAFSFDAGCTLVVPIHPDAVTPWVDCSASARAIRDGKIFQD
jgi:hypothetical protein